MNLCGLYSDDTKIYFNRYNNSATNSILVGVNVHLWDDSVKKLETSEIEVRKLDSVVKDKINLLHLDTQGSEYEILNGAKNLLDNNLIDIIRCQVEFEYLNSN